MAKVPSDDGELLGGQGPGRPARCYVMWSLGGRLRMVQKVLGKSLVSKGSAGKKLLRVDYGVCG